MLLGGRARRAWGWWVAVPLAVAAVLAAEFAVLGDRIAADVALVLESGRDAAPGPTGGAPAVVLPPVPQAPAPAAAGGVQAVDLRVLPGCVPGAECLVRIRVLVDAGSTPTVGWMVRADDLCARTGQVIGSGTLTVPAGSDRADVVTAVAVPTGPATALTAVTTLPAAAAADAVRVPPSGGCAP
ncbi:MAG: hypothetical protein OJJ54_25055 [Pseudonocardia sp.]|nr:hypothetical protein [Pseudonocardia sp.]